MNVREKYFQDHAELARNAFATHQIRRESDGRWVIMRPDELPGRWRSEYWTEIICTYGRGLYVDGDIDPVTFRHGPENFLARVEWMAHRTSAWDAYFREKACIGSGGRGSETNLRHFDRQVAIYDIGQLRQEAKEEGSMAVSHALGRVHEAILCDEITHEDVGRELYRAGHDIWEHADYVGIVPSTRMFYVHAALQRLHHLLRARGEYEGPDRDPS